MDRDQTTFKNPFQQISCWVLWVGSGSPIVFSKLRCYLPKSPTLPGQDASSRLNSGPKHRLANLDTINKLVLAESPSVASQLMLDYWLYTQVSVENIIFSAKELSDCFCLF